MHSFRPSLRAGVAFAIAFTDTSRRPSDSGPTADLKSLVRKILEKKFKLKFDEAEVAAAALAALFDTRREAFEAGRGLESLTGLEFGAVSMTPATEAKP